MREERLCLARHPDNGPAVLCPAGLQRLLADRALTSVRNGGDAISVDALGHEMITDRTGSPLSERLVRPGVSPLIRIALNEDARGGFVGLGRHDVAIPINQLQEQDGKYVLSGATKEAIKALPKFEYARK